MSLYVSIPLLALVAVFQATILPHFAVAGVHPDLMLLVVIAWGLLKGNPDALVWAFVGGVFLDALSGLSLGVGLIPLLVLAGASGAVAAGVSGRHVAVPLVGAFLGTLAYYAISLLILYTLGRATPFWTFWVQKVLPVSLLNVLTMVVVFPLAQGVYWLTHRRPMEI
ncbi:MAG: rod shape-determining protein MreD [Anaerolineae bacterium]